MKKSDITLKQIIKNKRNIENIPITTLDIQSKNIEDVINQLITIFNTAKKDEFTSIYIEHDEYNCEIYGARPETNAETRQRLFQQAKSKETIKNQQYQQYLELKSLFEKE